MEPKSRNRAWPPDSKPVFSSPPRCRYDSQSSIVDHIFPPVKSDEIDSPNVNQEFSSFAYWRDPIQVDLIAADVALPKQEVVEVIAEKVEEENRQKERKSSENSEKSEKGASESKEDGSKSRTERKEGQDEVMKLTGEPSSSSSSTTRSS